MIFFKLLKINVLMRLPAVIFAQKTTRCLTFILSVFLIALNACKHDVSLPTVDVKPIGLPCSKDTIYFQNQVLPLLVSTCAMSHCHNTQYHTLSFDMSNYAGILKLVRPNNADASTLYQVITDPDPTSKMPISPSPIWTDAQAQMLKTWINQGALNNVCNENYVDCDTTKITYSNFIQPLIMNNCQGCHIQKSWGGDMVLNTYEDVKIVAKSGQLNGCLAQKTGFSAMPKFQNPLSECTVNKIQAWIIGGMIQ